MDTNNLCVALQKIYGDKLSFYFQKGKFLKLKRSDDSYLGLEGVYTYWRVIIYIITVIFLNKRLEGISALPQPYLFFIN